MPLRATERTLLLLAFLMPAGAGRVPGLRADEVDRGHHYTVTVCLESADSFTLTRASSLVSRMYEAIGVKIEWRRPRTCPSEAIRVTMQDVSFPSEKPHALAYSTPYQGTRIVVFYDRILQREPRFVPALTAHVIAHEIGHILEGTNSHSASGVMKASWDENDLSEMAWKPLPFAPEDVFRIHQGLLSSRRWRQNPLKPVC